MAKVDIKMPDEFLERMSRLGKDFDTVAESVLKAGGEVVLQKVQSNLSAVVGSGTKYESRSTGELETALGLTLPRPIRTATTMSRSALPNRAVMAAVTKNLQTSWSTASTVSLQSPF